MDPRDPEWYCAARDCGARLSLAEQQDCDVRGDHICAECYALACARYDAAQACAAAPRPSRRPRAA
jgi:hypothetical protein